MIRQPLQWNAEHSKDPILSISEITAIFGNIQAIQQLSEQLLSMFNTKLEEWTPFSCIGKPFFGASMFFLFLFFFRRKLEFVGIPLIFIRVNLISYHLYSHTQ